MSLVGVLGWTFLVLLLSFLALDASAALRPGLRKELVNTQICFILGFSLATMLMARLHLPTRAANDALGARKVGGGFYALGALTGLALYPFASWTSSLVDARWPLSEEAKRTMIEMATFSSGWHKVVFVLVVAAVGPFFEEMFCRGVMFRALRRGHGAALTVLATSVSFGLLHIEPRYMLNAVICGLVFGMLRLFAGSVAVPLAAHVAYNAVVAAELILAGPDLLAKMNEPALPQAGLWGAVGAVVVAGLVYATRALGLRNEGVREAREADED